jgi:hypothetical protein
MVELPPGRTDAVRDSQWAVSRSACLSARHRLTRPRLPTRLRTASSFDTLAYIINRRHVLPKNVLTPRSARL